MRNQLEHFDKSLRPPGRAGRGEARGAGRGARGEAVLRRWARLRAGIKRRSATPGSWRIPSHGLKPMATLIWSLRDPFSANVLLVLMLLMLVLSAQAQTNAPVRLALISETDEAATAAEVLTAQFSGNAKVQLLERDEIAKVYREQGLAAGNTDYLKLGRLLGADGLLLLQTVTEGTNQSVNVRLVAVKPGVVLVAERFDWPIKDLTEWSAALAGHLDRFLPKLVVLVKDAIPLSVVNLRSAISAAEAGETERQLKLLTIQRLSGEPQLFVLERQQMGLLGAEKDLQADDSAFWNGSYLFEGVVDQNGYSTETITINARLSPPKGGAPVTFEVSGSRTNLAAVVNQLAMKVEAALKVHPTVTEWNAADEARQYFKEAQWALRWGVYEEAQAAADSAWALGKQDLECAVLRMRAYLLELSGVVGGYRYIQHGRYPGVFEMPNLSPVNPTTRIKVQTAAPGRAPATASAPTGPKIENLDRAAHVLELYTDLSRTPAAGGGWHDSEWDQLGMDDLLVAAHAVKKFAAAPESAALVADKLDTLRDLARSVAGMISIPPSGPDVYLPDGGTRPVNRDDLAQRMDHLASDKSDLAGAWGQLWEVNAFRVDFGAPLKNGGQSRRAPTLQPTRPTPPPPPAPAAGQTAVTLSANPVSAESGTNRLRVDKFLPIPMDDLPGKPTSEVYITAHHWFEGRLLLDLKYGVNESVFDAQGNWQSTRTITLNPIAILDPATERWEVIPGPPADQQSLNRFYHRSVLWHKTLFTSNGGKIATYDFNRREWRALTISDGNNDELFVVNDHLYAANREMIAEVVEGGQSTRLLASTRRDPPVTVLDTEDLGTPILFAGPGHSLRVTTQNKLFTRTGADWREELTVPASTVVSEIFPAGILIRYSSDGVGLLDSLSRVLTEATFLERCIGPKTTLAVLTAPGFPQPYAAGPNSAPPLWTLPPKTFLANYPATLLGSNIYLLAGHAEIQNAANDPHPMDNGSGINADGYNATLLCYTPGLPDPQKIFLNFDAPAGVAPLAGLNPDSNPRYYPGIPPAWLLFGDHHLLFGAETPPAMSATRSGSVPGRAPGVWLMPVNQLEPAFAAQRRAQLAGVAQAAAGAEKTRDQRSAKYDPHHNGILSPDEKESFLDDPAFIEFELDNIDTNHNGWLDAEELAWFDANQDRILDPKEQAGIEIAKHLLAVRLLKKYDLYDEGALNGREYQAMIQETLGDSPNAEFELGHVGAQSGQGQRVDLAALETALQRRIESHLRSNGPRFSFPQPKASDTTWADYGRQEFKRRVEAYWQNPPGTPYRPQFQRGLPGSPGFDPSRMPPRPWSGSPPQLPPH